MADGDQTQPDWRPRPDPTLLTTAALTREIAALKELLNARIGCEQELRDEKADSLWRHIERTEQLRLEQKADTKTSIDAALQAQKEAAEKAENAVAQQLAEIKATVDTTVDGLRREIADLKERLGRAESAIVG